MPFFRICAAVMLAAVLFSGSATASDDNVLQAKKHFSFAVQNKKAGNYGEADRQFKKSLSFCDSIYNIHYSYGDLMLKMNRPGEAVRSFRTSLALNPGHYASAAMCAKLYYESAAYDSALVMYRIMHTLKPDNMDILTSIASLSEFLGHTDEAYRCFVSLIEQGRDSCENIMRASRLALKRGDPASAGTYAEMALAKKPDDIEALTIAGETSLALNERNRAAVYYRRIAEADPSSVDPLAVLEDIYRTESDHRNLIWALERHARLVPDDLEVIGELSELLYAENQMDKGIVYVRKGIEIAPEDGRFRILLGENYRSLGQKDKALSEYAVAMNDPEWKTTAQRLMWQIEKPESAEEKAEREFFSRGRAAGEN